MRHSFRSFLVAAILLGAGFRSTAQEATFKPIVVISMSSHERTMQRMRYIGAMSPNDADGSNFIKNASKLFSMLTRAEGIQLDQIDGIDGTKPWGMAVVTNQLDIIPVAFIPVTDLEKALATLKPILGEAKAGDGGIYEVDASRMLGALPVASLLGASGVEMYVKEQNGWALLVQLPEHFDLIGDPAKFVGDLPGNYDVTIRLNVRNIPEALRTMAVDRADGLQLSGVSLAPKRAADETEAQFAFREQLGKPFQNFGTAVLRDAEQLAVGLTVDQEHGQIVGDLVCAAMPDTPLARHFADLSAVKTRFGGLVPKGDELFAGGMTIKLDTERISALSKLLEAYRGAVSDLIDNEPAVHDEERDVFHELSDGLISALQTAVDSGKLDMALNVRTAPGNQVPWTMVAAAAIPDTKPLDQLLHRLAELTEAEPSAGAVEFDVDHQGEVAIHVVTLSPRAESGQELQMLTNLFGDLKIHVALAPNGAWVAMGGGALESIKKAIEGGEADVPPMRMTMHASPLLPILAQSMKSPQLGMAMAMMGMQLASGDAVKVKVESTDRTLHVHGIGEKGFLNLATTIVQLLPALMK